MLASSSDLITVLRRYNHLRWRGTSPADLPAWKHRAFHDILSWMQSLLDVRGVLSRSGAEKADG
jgi:hypothetical protein